MNAHHPRLLQRGVSAPLLAVLLLVAGLLAASGFALAEDELPGRVGRVAEFGGDLFVAPQDQPDQWIAIGLNYPITSGDNLWVAQDGHAEVDFGGGVFRLGDNTNLHVSCLDERNLALYIAQGGVILRIRVLDPGDSAIIDTPNAQVVLTRPGQYRIEVSDDRQHTQLAVREGEANVLVAAAGQQVLPGQSAGIDGGDPQDILVRDGFTTDGFDTWSAQRDRIYERGRASSYVSRQMVGYADLDANGTWETVADYGAVWYPSAVAPDWTPYSDGYWTDVSGWGSTWVDAAPWGYAPFHYGRWAHIRGRWAWCPGSYVARPVWAPALVGWVGGPGWGVSPVRGSIVYGWVPLGWAEAYRPPPGRCGSGCWERYNRPYAVSPASRASPTPARFANVAVPGAMTAVPGAVIASRKPVPINRVSVPGNLVASAPPLQQAPMARPEPGQVPGIKPGNGVPRPASTMSATNVRRGSPNPFAPSNFPQGSGVAAGSRPAARQGAAGQSPMSGTPPAPANHPVQGSALPPATEPSVRAAPPLAVSPTPTATRSPPPATSGTSPQVNTYIRPVPPVPALPPERAGGSQGQAASGRTDARSLPLPANVTTPQSTVPPNAVPSTGTVAVRPAPPLPPGTMPAPMAAAFPGTANVRPAPQLPAAAMPAPLAAPSPAGASVRPASQLPPRTMPAPLAVPPSGHPANVAPTGPPPAGQPNTPNPGNPAVRAPTDKEKAAVPANANPNAPPGSPPVR